MKWNHSGRDPWVWAQFAGLGVVLIVVPWLAWTTGGSGLLTVLLRHDGLTRLAGLAPALAGTTLMLASARSLGRNLTPTTTPVPEGELIAHGLYARVRHPMYSGLILLYWGLGWIGSNWRFGLLIGLFSWLFFDRKASVEERKLLERYPGYAAYAGAVPKLVPRLGR